MKLKGLTPNLMTDNMDATLDFYLGLLGFEVVMQVPERPPYDWIMMTRDKVMLMFQSRKSVQEDLNLLGDKNIGGSMAFFTEVEGIDEWFELLKDKVEICLEMRTTFYGMTEFGFYDVNGYLIIFAERKSA